MSKSKFFFKKVLIKIVAWGLRIILSCFQHLSSNAVFRHNELLMDRCGRCAWRDRRISGLDVKMLIMNLQKRKEKHNCFRNIKSLKSVYITLDSDIIYIDCSYSLIAYCTRLVELRRTLVMYSDLGNTASNFYLWFEIFIPCYVCLSVYYNWYFLCKHKISLPYSYNSLFYSIARLAYRFQFFQNKWAPVLNCFANCEVLLLLLKEIKCSVNPVLKRRPVWPT